jgi:hypothetical protein
MVRVLLISAGQVSMRAGGVRLQRLQYAARERRKGEIGSGFMGRLTEENNPTITAKAVIIGHPVEVPG